MTKLNTLLIHMCDDDDNKYDDYDDDDGDGGRSGGDNRELSKDIGDVNVCSKKVKVYIGKTITLHVHHAFLCISLPSLFE